MAEGFTFNLTNPTSTEQSATVFESPEVLAAAGQSTATGEFIDQKLTPVGFNPDFACYIEYKNAFLIVGDIGSEVKAAFYFIDTGQFSAVSSLGINTFLRSDLTGISNLTDNNGDVGQGCLFLASNPVSASGFSQVLARFDSNENDAPILEVISNEGVPSFAVVSTTFYIKDQNAVVFILRQGLFTYRLGVIEGVADSIGAALRTVTVYNTGIPLASFPQQFKIDENNGLVFWVTNSSSNFFQVYNIRDRNDPPTPAPPLYPRIFDFGTAGIEKGDAVYVEHLNQFWLYATTNGGTTFDMFIFDISVDLNISLSNTVVDFLGSTASTIGEATMFYDSKYKQILFKGINNTGYAFYDIDNNALKGFNNLDNIGSTIYDQVFDATYPSGDFFNRVFPTTGQKLTIFSLSTGEDVINYGTNLGIAGTFFIDRYRQAGAFDSNQVNYIVAGGGIGAPSDLINIFSGANTLGSSQVAVNTQAGNQTYPEVLQSLQNQDYVITDFYVKTNSVAQANKRIAISYTSPNGETYEDEIFPTINPMQPQVVLKDLETKFVSNALNTIQIDILPNETVELIATYETFERNEGEAFPDINTINRILNAPEQNREILKQIWGEGVFTGTTEPTPPTKKKQPIHITLDSPFARVIYKRAKI
tara:strand:- start:4702 stop:6642 length:1941 start_codon:yes stop_codon:yes gene_type:complete